MANNATIEGRPVLGAFLGDILAFVFLVAAGLIIVGLMLPAFHVSQFWFFTRDVTILGGIRDLAEDGQPALGWLMLFLSVLVPLSKTLVGFIIAMWVRTGGPTLRALIALFDFLGKFSFVDVFVVAILVIVLDGRLLTKAQLGPGIYDFGAGVALSWLATIVLRRAIGRV